MTKTRNIKIHVDMSREEIEIIDIFCEQKGMSRPQVMRYAWRTYLSSEKIMEMENEQRIRFARQQKWETKMTGDVPLIVEVDSRKKNKCKCGEYARYMVEESEKKTYICKKCMQKNFPWDAIVRVV